MYIISNAFKNLGRNKSRNLLLGIILFALILSVTIALVINTTTKGIIEDYKNRFGSKVTLRVDFDKLMAESKDSEKGYFSFPLAPEISPEQYLSFADSDYLKSYRIDMCAGVTFDQLKALGDEKRDGMTSSIGGGTEEYVSPKAKLMGFSDIKDLPDFADGKRKIIDGTLFQEQKECIISSDFAELNQLRVNDTFQVMDTNSKQWITLTITGIYADATKASGDLPPGAFSMQSAYDNRRNEIFVTMDTMQESFAMDHLIVNASYELKSPEGLEAFEAELRDKGLSDVYDVSTDEASYHKIVAPVIGLSSISMTFLWVILGIGIIILLFVTTMAVRERKYEIGVLRAMGLKKTKVAYMLVAESMMVTAVCLILGLGIGKVCAQPVADALINHQVEVTSQSNELEFKYSTGNSAGSIGMEEEVEPMSELKVALTLEAILQITAIALALALFASSVGVIFITKYEPMKILSERN